MTASPSFSDSRMFSLNSRIRIELVGFDAELPVEPAVLERRCGLCGDGGEERHVFAAQRLRAGLPAQRHDRNGPILRDARNEVVDPCLAPEVDFTARRVGVARADRRA